MTDLVLGGCGPRVLLSHLALYGLGAILDAVGADVRIGWTEGSDPRPFLGAQHLGTGEIASLVQRHAQAAATPDSWLHRDVTLNGSPRGLMSPRLTPFADATVWESVQAQRHAVLDTLTTARAWLDLRMLAALGEPAYWSRNRKNEPLQDDGASRLEMQPRNQGSEFVGSRLRKLALAVANRDPAAIASGLTGEAVRDEVGADRSDSRTATGLAAPGPTDNALAWCALWGIAQFPIAMRVAGPGARSPGTAMTTGHLGRSRNEWFYVPIWQGPWRTARLRTVLAGGAARTAAGQGLELRAGPPGPADVAAASAWLLARGVQGLVRFPIERFGSDSAPERRAMRGQLVPLGARG